MKVPNVPPPCNITFPTLFTSSRPLRPYLKMTSETSELRNSMLEDPVDLNIYLRAENPPNNAPLAIPTQNPIVKP